MNAVYRYVIFFFLQRAFPKYYTYRARFDVSNYAVGDFII